MTAIVSAKPGAVRFQSAAEILQAVQLGVLRPEEARLLLGVPPAERSHTPPSPEPVAGLVARDESIEALPDRQLVPIAGIPGWFASLSDAYIRRLRLRNRRDTTVRNNALVLGLFGAWLGQVGISDGAQLRIEDVYSWLESKQLGANSRAAYTSVVRSALRWGAMNGLGVDPGIAMRIEPAKRLKGRPRPLATAQLAELRAYLHNVPTSLAELRDRALFFVLFSTAARISEVLQLNRDSFVDRTAFVIEKGGGQKQLMLTAQAERAIEEYLRARRDLSPALFVTHARQLEGKRLTAKAANYAWLRLCARLGLHGFTNHRLRHTSITELVDKDVPLEVAITIAGHHSAATIMNYLDVAPSRKRRFLHVLEGPEGDKERPTAEAGASA
ncbi:hypothetical protein EPN29_13555 [bacterium]|nr:MAG: hypothetical protein EPN29_13555 [bacterium]